MKKYKIIFFVLLLPCFSQAQQTPLLAHYYQNLSVINPSVVGYHNQYDLSFNGRQQWSNFADATIRNSSLTLNKGFGVNGLGFQVFTDNSGNLKNAGLSVKYAYKTPISSKSQLYFGLSGGYFNRSLENISEYDLPYITSTNNWLPSASFGLSFKRDQLIVGTSVDGLIQSNYGFSNSQENVFERHIFTFISYQFKASSNIVIAPSVLHKFPLGGSAQYEVNMNLEYKGMLTFGLGYKGGMIKEYNFGPSATLGFNIGKIESLYSQDVIMNDVSAYSSGTSELSLRYRFGKEEGPAPEVISKKKEVVEQKPDADKDGVPDEIDECPNVFGSVEAKGCPDVDRDGVNDDLDLCPNTLGDILNGGCPVLTEKDSTILKQAITNLEFDVDSEVIKPSSYPTLTNIAKLMLANRNMVLIISGHTDSDASDDYNVSLSAKRAKSVKDFFESRGISKHRLVMDFYGETKPIFPNNNELNKSKNRRVEFHITFM